MLEKQIETKNKPDYNFIGSLVKNLFSSDIEETQLERLTIDDLNALIKRIDDSLNMMQSFYKVNFKELFIKKIFSVI